MGRGRAKAKQTKVARALKYGGPQTDLQRLQAELSGGQGKELGRADDEADGVEDPYADDPYAKDPYAKDPYAKDPYDEDDPYADDPYAKYYEEDEEDGSGEDSSDDRP